MRDHQIERDTPRHSTGLFVTAVGTGVGKTLVTTILCHQWKANGRAVFALKPVVSGFSAGDAESDPALILRSLGESPTSAAVAAIAPWRFTRPLSPHLAARLEGQQLSIDAVVDFCEARQPGGNGMLLIEGAGGVMTPLNDHHTMLDLIARLGHPALLVTGSYLGAISHTLTALAVLRARGVPVQAVVVSESAESAGLDDTVAAIHDFGGHDLAVVPLARLGGNAENKHRAAPLLIDFGAAPMAGL